MKLETKTEHLEKITAYLDRAALSSQSLSLSEAREEIERREDERKRQLAINMENIDKAVAAERQRDEAEAVLHGLFRAPVHLDGCLHKDNARLHCQFGAQDRYRALEARVHKLLRARDDRPVLENSPAGLGDATNDPADLSSLRKGAEELRRKLAGYAITEEYDFPGDAPEFCGFWCNECKEHVEADGSGHRNSCLCHGERPQTARAALVSGSREEQS